MITEPSVNATILGHIERPSALGAATFGRLRPMARRDAPVSWRKVPLAPRRARVSACLGALSAVGSAGCQPSTMAPRTGPD